MTSIQVAGCTPAVAYLPSSIVQTPKPVVDYARFMTNAPAVALSPIRADGVEEQPLQRSKRHRTRLHVGSTNRWRLPQNLLSDLLGMSQATKSLPTYPDLKPFNSSYIRICTAEGRHSFLNDDANQEIPLSRKSSAVTIDSSNPRSTHPLKSSLLGSRYNKAVIEPRNAKSAPVTIRLPRNSSSPSKLGRFVPDRARPSTTKEVFYYHSKQNREHHGSPDIVLHCIGLDLELHSTVLKRSAVLCELLGEALQEDPTETTYYKSSVNAALDSLVQSAGLDYDNNEEEKLCNAEIERATRKAIDHPAHISKRKQGKLINITWDIQDGTIKKDAMAIALGNLYHTRFQVEDYELANVLMAAYRLEFAELIYFCVDQMRKCINYSNISSFYSAAVRSEQKELFDSCIRWLELNLITVMINKIQLRDLPISLLETVLKSSRLFTYNEYQLYACLSLWLFLRLNPQIQLLPTTTNVITYFNSLPKHCSFLESEGQSYVELFENLRLHGITDTAQFENIRRMNILTQDSMVSLLSEHYSALQSGGDMALMRNFKKSSVRQGYMIEQELPYHTEILSLHGFHFELKTVKTGDCFTFFMQRLKPTDPVLSFRQCERQTFSMRPDRDVRYSITVQTYHNGVQQLQTTGMETQRFSLTGKLTRSKVLSLRNIEPPLYVTFAILFPQS